MSNFNATSIKNYNGNVVERGYKPEDTHYFKPRILSYL